MRSKRITGYSLFAVLLAFLLVAIVAPAVMAETWEIDDINYLHDNGSGDYKVNLSAADLDRDGIGGDVSTGDTIVLTFTDSDLQTSSIVVDVENVTIRGEHSRADHTVYAGDGFVEETDVAPVMFKIIRDGVTLKNFTMTSNDTSSSSPNNGELSSAVLVTGDPGDCELNGGKDFTFENLKIAEQAEYGGSNLINKAFHFQQCCNPYKNVLFKNVVIDELGSDSSETLTDELGTISNGNVVAGFYFDRQLAATDGPLPFALKSISFKNVQIYNVRGPGIRFDNGNGSDEVADLTDIIVENSTIKDNAGHGIVIEDNGLNEVDVEWFEIDSSYIESNSSTVVDPSGVYIGGSHIGDLRELRILDSSLSSNEEYGLYVDAENVYDPLFDGVSINSNGSDGVQINTANDIHDARILDQSMFYNNGDNGVFLNPVDSVESDTRDWGLNVVDSSFKNNGADDSIDDSWGLRIEAGEDVKNVKVEGSKTNEKTAEGNADSDGGGVYYYAGRYMDHIEFINFTASNNDRGIELQGVDKVHDVTVTDSTVKNGSDFGLFIHSSPGFVSKVSIGGNPGSSFVNNTNAGIEITGLGGVGDLEEGEGISITNTAVEETNSGPGLFLKNNNTEDEKHLVNVTISEGTFNDNDEGGIVLESESDIDDVTISANNVRRNLRGVDLHAIYDLQNVEIKDNQVTGNAEEGIRANCNECGGTSPGLSITDNLVTDGEVGIDLKVNETCGLISVSENYIIGDSAGTGIKLDTRITNVTYNDIRDWDVGVLVLTNDTNEEVHINNNNIEDNNDFGVEAGSGLEQPVDAKKNWWGYASGPGSSKDSVTDPETGTLADGEGDWVNDNVRFDPWLKKEAVPPKRDWEIVSHNIPSTGDLDTAVTFTLKVENTTGSYGSTEVYLLVNGEVISGKTKTVSLAAGATSSKLSFTYTFTSAGSYTIKLKTKDDSKTGTIEIGGVGVEPSWGDKSGIPPVTLGQSVALALKDSDGNPVSPTSVEIKIYDPASGKLLETVEDSTFTLSSGDFDPGVYAYTVNVNDGEYRSPVMLFKVKWTQ